MVEKRLDTRKPFLCPRGRMPPLGRQTRPGGGTIVHHQHRPAFLRAQDALVKRAPPISCSRPTNCSRNWPPSYPTTAQPDTISWHPGAPCPRPHPHRAGHRKSLRGYSRVDPPALPSSALLVPSARTRVRPRPHCMPALWGAHHRGPDGTRLDSLLPRRRRLAARPPPISPPRPPLQTELEYAA